MASEMCWRRREVSNSGSNDSDTKDNNIQKEEQFQAALNSCLYS